MQLILDLSLRTPNLKNVERFNEQSLYLNILDEPAPGQSIFTHTIAYRKQRLNEILLSDEPNNCLSELYAAVKSDISRPGENGSGDNVNQGSYRELMHHIENAVFLICMEAGFIKDSPQNITDASYCREWVLGIQEDFADESDIDESARIMKDLWKAFICFEATLPVVSKGSGSSEATALLTAIKQVKQRPFAKKIENESFTYNPNTKKAGSKASHTSDFIKSFRARFITSAELEAALKVSKASVSRYIKDNNIRVFSPTRETKFLYREDIEAFLEDKTER